MMSAVDVTPSSFHGSSFRSLLASDSECFSRPSPSGSALSGYHLEGPFVFRCLESPSEGFQRAKSVRGNLARDSGLQTRLLTSLELKTAAWALVAAAQPARNYNDYRRAGTGYT